MTWEDALRIGAVVVASLGGGGAIVLGLSGYIGRIWADRIAEDNRRESEAFLTKLKGDVDASLQRHEHALGHRSFLMQRFAEMELEALRECWRTARACLPAINAPRAINGGTDLADLARDTEALRVAHNALLESLNKHEPFLGDDVVELLETALLGTIQRSVAVWRRV